MWLFLVMMLMFGFVFLWLNVSSGFCLESVIKLRFILCFLMIGIGLWFFFFVLV